MAYLILDEQKLRDGIVKHHLGSILNCGGQARTVQNWQEIITKMQDVATKETRLGIPILYGIDTIHGANYVLDATIFPQNIAMAATGNVALMEKNGEISALETRATGIPWNFGPGPRPGPPADVAPRVRDLRRGPVHRLDDGGRLHPRPAGRRHLQPGQGRRLHEALPRV